MTSHYRISCLHIVLCFSSYQKLVFGIFPAEGKDEFTRSDEIKCK